MPAHHFLSNYWNQMRLFDGWLNILNWFCVPRNIILPWFAIHLKIKNSAPICLEINKKLIESNCIWWNFILNCWKNSWSINQNQSFRWIYNNAWMNALKHHDSLEWFLINLQTKSKSTILKIKGQKVLTHHDIFWTLK